MVKKLADLALTRDPEAALAEFKLLRAEEIQYSQAV